MKPCPFCGLKVELEDGDTLYPTSGWKERANGMREYCLVYEAPPEQWCYTMHCPTTAGGCGAEISGDSMQEAMDKWNRRV
jgi:hypothetical protein